MRSHDYFVYLLTNRTDGTLYCGVSNDLLRRLSEHRAGQVDSFTRKYNCHHLVWFEHHSDVTEAIRREKRIKKWNRAWKLRLIEESNPGWRDLAEGLGFEKLR